jgi:hypothetical protein
MLVGPMLKLAAKAIVQDLVQLITDLKESLEREFSRQILELRDEMRAGFAQLNTRFDTQAARLDRHAALLQTGSRWTTRMNSWAEKVDSALEEKDRQIAELRARLDRLESSGGARQ